MHPIEVENRFALHSFYLSIAIDYVENVAQKKYEDSYVLSIFSCIKKMTHFKEKKNYMQQGFQKMSSPE